jgi:hypothetical protein
MSQLVKTKRQANFKGFKRFGAFKGLVEQKNVVLNSFVCKWAFLARVGHFKTRVKRGPIYTQTRQIIVVKYMTFIKIRSHRRKFSNSDSVEQKTTIFYNRFLQLC